MHAVNVLKIKSITHKFLIKGHSQNEGDNVHSIIEKKIKRSLKSGPIYVPDQYITLIRTAKNTHPFEVVEMSHKDFMDLKDLSTQYGSNFSKDILNNTILMNDIKMIKIEKCHPTSFFCKTSYKDTAYKEVHVNRNKRNDNPVNIKTITLRPLYTNRIPLDAKKKASILSLFKINKKTKQNEFVIPAYYLSFYKSL